MFDGRTLVLVLVLITKTKKKPDSFSLCRTVLQLQFCKGNIFGPIIHIDVIGQAKHKHRDERIFLKYYFSK